MLSDDRRREIADFLKTRRMRRQPEELGLPLGDAAGAHQDSGGKRSPLLQG